MRLLGGEEVAGAGLVFLPGMASFGSVHKATRYWDVTLPGKTDSLIPNGNSSGDATVTPSYSAELLRSYSNIVGCLAVRL